MSAELTRWSTSFQVDAIFGVISSWRNFRRHFKLTHFFDIISTGLQDEISMNLNPGPNRTTSVYTATISLARYRSKIILLRYKNDLAYYNARL
jgi:hypothetical protein